MSLKRVSIYALFCYFLGIALGRFLVNDDWWSKIECQKNLPRNVECVWAAPQEPKP